MSKATFTIGVFAAIFDNKNRILFCHRNDYDLWNLPGGALEKSEAPWEGVVREVKEETGLDVEVERLAGIYSKPRENDIVLQFVCNVIGGEITLNNEADKIKYFAYDDIPAKVAQKQVERLKDIFENPGKLVMKTQKSKSTLQLIKEGLL